MAASESAEVVVLPAGQTEPAARLKGRFSLFDLPDGGIHIAWLADGIDESETQHFELPGKIMKMAQLAAEGKLNPIQMAKALME